MELITDPQAFQARCLAMRGQGLDTALVPTMGWLHDGHVSLVKWARDNARRVLVSVFVNPAQFDRADDLEAYPRDLDRDAALAEAAGADILFAPRAEDVYAPDHATWVRVPDLERHLCGASRPGHFQGVCTVVAKLFNLAMPAMAVFGDKDWQQLAIIRRMARDLDFPVRVVGRPIVRETDGLAMSSRNVRLSPVERAQAPGIFEGLCMIRDMAAKGGDDPAQLRAALELFYAQRLPDGQMDYIEFVDPEAITPVERLLPRTLVAVAVGFATARLIDNMLVGTEAA